MIDRPMNTPDYDLQHDELNELAVLNQIDKLLAEANKLVIDFEIPDPRAEDSYPTVEKIEVDLGPYPTTVE
jgi:hypothetical protein